ncbi:STAS domain-containing protein [Gloeobacter kilaueensis]|uniref:Anti-sigma-factor antagonist n=1 Tax=Gloeobacter kilaueensis (strain ATCC BAA-2537 / CCAP 1431/1 / ULC 316 / JS1) TaxID=1183438 RepID=U5QEJ0_GLOK1|nr:STAS domain-containing protein [Gloeobacter kilaueensis]AGY57352.1 anti-sigma-factor antagonist [Gloeobacter kilaueensis JS1]
MGSTGENRLLTVLIENRQKLVDDWIEEQSALKVWQNGLIGRAELTEQCTEFVQLLSGTLNSDYSADFKTAAWDALRDFLRDIVASRLEQGFTPMAIATFVLSFKQPLFENLRRAYGEDAGALVETIWSSTALIDKLALWTTEVFQLEREAVITRQQQEMLELSTPVVQLWRGILALPLVGTLDSSRTQEVMESLLQQIVETSAQFVIIDITGVPTVDTQVAQYLLKTVAAARLMGTECIISGIRPQIAQTIIHLGLDLSSVTTKAVLADAFAVALARSNLKICPASDHG